LEGFSLGTIWHFRLSLLLAVITIASCGPKPQLKLRTDGSPEAVWKAYQKRFENVKSLALKGTLESQGAKPWACGFQITYASPDSFTFLGEGILGTDLFRGAVVADSGFWEVPRDKKYWHLSLNEKLKIEEAGVEIALVQLLNSVFIFKLGNNFVYKRTEGKQYTYCATTDSAEISLTLDSQTCLPTRLNWGSIPMSDFVEYSNWKEFGNNLVYASKIKAYTAHREIEKIFKITRARRDIAIPKSLYMSKMQ
jgi:hypothetical protein